MQQQSPATVLPAFKAVGRSWKASSHFKYRSIHVDMQCNKRWRSSKTVSVASSWAAPDDGSVAKVAWSWRGTSARENMGSEQEFKGAQLVDIVENAAKYSLAERNKALEQLRKVVLMHGIPDAPYQPPSASTRAGSPKNRGSREATTGSFGRRTRPDLSLTKNTRSSSLDRARRGRSFNAAVRAKGDPSVGHKQQLTLRGRIWKVLLGVRKLDAERYIRLVKKGPHPVYSRKIQNDTFRTFQKDMRFSRRVPEKRLIRILNAFVHAHAKSGDESEFSYVQGMNVVAGPLLYVMPELDAFACFEVLITKHLPRYVTKNLDGVQQGCELVEQLLHELDGELSTHLRDNLRASARIYAFAPVLTLCACSPPLEEVLKLWDVYFAAGVHLNVVLYTAQLILLRDVFLNPPHDGSSDGKQHRTSIATVETQQASYISGREFPIIEPESILSVAFPLLFKIPRDVYDEIVRHPLQVCEREAEIGVIEDDVL